MAETTIEWADYTFNPWIGCTKVSPACDNCYAENWGKRFGVKWGHKEPRKRTSDANWRKPLEWNRKAEKEGKRPRVFCASLADVFDVEVPFEWRRDLFTLIAMTPHLDWLLLTKRPQVMLTFAIQHGWPENAWAGTTVENQEMAAARIPMLSAMPAKVRFLSMEPLQGPVDLSFWPDDAVQWVIVGGESGHGARPMHPNWARSLRDQCQAAGVAFFFKQWGEYAAEFRPGTAVELSTLAANQSVAWGDGKTNHTLYTRVGKKQAGRLLDGREWNEFPAAPSEAPHGK
jgi:protein gp37